MPIEMQKNIYHERDNYSADQAPSATGEVSYQMGQERDKAASTSDIFGQNIALPSVCLSILFSSYESTLT